MSNTGNAPSVPIIPATTNIVNASDPPNERATSPDPDLIQIRTTSCQRLVNEAVSGSLPGGSFLTRLRETGISDAEAQDYIDQVMQRRDQQRALPPGPQGDPHSPPGTEEAHGAPNPADAASSLAWAVLRAKVDQIEGLGSRAPQTSSPSFITDEIANLLGLPNAKGTLPPSVLAKAPHLVELSVASAADPHLESTQELVSVFSPQAIQDTLVGKALFASVHVPLPRTIWRKIILDQFVDFEKLFASMEKGYDHHDDPKDFGAGYALVKKDQAFTKRKLRTESDWTRVFDAWSAGTVFFFRHRESELRAYRSLVMEFFRAAPNDPLVAIEYDVEVRDKYARKPFRLDNQDQLNFPLLAQVFRGSTSSFTPRSSTKRIAPSSLGSTPKRVDVPCRNWSYGSCKADPCPNRRKHGICCICGEGHRARDNEKCFSILQTRV
jgi:hypothetical protein